MAEQSSWNFVVRQGVRVAGALLMWQIGQRMPKKYNITGEGGSRQAANHVTGRIASSGSVDVWRCSESYMLCYMQQCNESVQWVGIGAWFWAPGH
jgi:hypothetical protein